MTRRAEALETEQTRSEAMISAMALLSGRMHEASSFSRRQILHSLVMGTAGLAVSPLTGGASGDTLRPDSFKFQRKPLRSQPKGAGRGGQNPTDDRLLPRRD